MKKLQETRRKDIDLGVYCYFLFLIRQASSNYRAAEFPVRIEVRRFDQKILPQVSDHALDS